jgi:two-component system NarL family response regulator
MGAKLRIIIADDHALFREGLRSLLRLEPKLTVVAEVDRVDELLRTLEETRCDLLLLDLQMESNALLQIPALAEKVPIIVVTASEHPGETLSAIRSGARAVVFKRCAIDTLIKAIETVAAGQMWIPPELQTAAVVGAENTLDTPLTRRELEITRCVARGLRNVEVGRELCISEQTVKTHLNNIFQKLHVRDRVELVLYATRVGITTGTDDPGRAPGGVSESDG